MATLATPLKDWRDVFGERDVRHRSGRLRRDQSGRAEGEGNKRDDSEEKSLHAQEATPKLRAVQDFRTGSF